MDQPTDEPSEGMDTSPSTSRPWVLWMHDQHVADYVCIMVELGMSLPMGEDWSVPLVMEVLSLFSPYSLLIPSCISLLVFLCTAIHLFISAFIFTQALQKIRLANHIHSLAEFGGCGSAGVTSAKTIKCTVNEHTTTGSTTMIYYCTSSSTDHFGHITLTSLDSYHGCNRNSGTG